VPVASRSDVLVVDDEPSVRDFLVDVVADAGYSVVAASDGVAALQLIDDGFRPQLVITDLRMPKLNGLELAGEIRSRFAAHPPAVAVMSADHRRLDRVDGVVAKLPKPFPVQMLTELVASHCMPA